MWEGVGRPRGERRGATTRPVGVWQVGRRAERGAGPRAPRRGRMAARTGPAEGCLRGRAQRSVGWDGAPGGSLGGDAEGRPGAGAGELAQRLLRSAGLQRGGPRRGPGPAAGKTWGCGQARRGPGMRGPGGSGVPEGGACRLGWRFPDGCWRDPHQLCAREPAAGSPRINLLACGGVAFKGAPGKENLWVLCRKGARGADRRPRRRDLWRVELRTDCASEELPATVKPGVTARPRA